LKFWLIFIYIHSFGELFYLWAKAQDFTWVNGDVHFHVNFNENLFPGTVHEKPTNSSSFTFCKPAVLGSGCAVEGQIRFR
jgi:hypothetical protein